MTFLFWLSVSALCYIYFGYPLCAWALGLRLRRQIKKQNDHPSVSIITAAYNEAQGIAAAIENKRQLRYPADKVEYIIISDGSDDGTDEIIQTNANQAENPFPIRYLRQETRGGKTAALNRAVSEAKGEILVFADANSLYDQEALHYLTQNFADSEVGYVTGKMLYVVKQGASASEGTGAYMKYENFLRSLENQIGSVVGVDGGIDAVRRGLYEPLSASDLPDFVLPLKVVTKGYRVVYEERALVREEALDASRDEFSMRVRVSLRAFHAIWNNRQLLNFTKYPLYAWQLTSHKILRYLAGFFQILLFLSNIFAPAGERAYWYYFLAQAAFYAAAWKGWQRDKAGRNCGAFYVPYYFCLINVAALVAAIKFLKGQNIVVWNPRKG